MVEKVRLPDTDVHVLETDKMNNKRHFAQSIDCLIDAYRANQWPETASGRTGIAGISHFHLWGQPTETRAFEQAMAWANTFCPEVREWIIHLEDLPNQLLIDTALASIRKKAQKWRINYVLDDPAKGVQELEKLHSALRIHYPELDIGDPSLTFKITIPLTGRSSSYFFPLWYWLDSHGYGFQVTINLDEIVEAENLYGLALCLENLANCNTVKFADREQYRLMRDAVLDGEIDRLQPEKSVLLAEGEREKLREVIRQGVLALPSPNLSYMKTAGYYIKSSKINQLFKLAGTLTSFLTRGLQRSRELGVDQDTEAPPRILVLGWYGTETVGDKAILGGLLGEISKRHPDFELTLLSSLPFYSEQTLRELGYEQRSVVMPYDYGKIEKIMPDHDLVAIGGGPLMDLVEMLDLVLVFRIARLHGVSTVIAGCGIGPVRWPFTRLAVRYLFNGSELSIVRDQNSLHELKKLGLNTDKVICGADPSFAYTTSALDGRRNNSDAPMLGMGIRELPQKYTRDLSKQERLGLRDNLRRTCAEIADRFIGQFGGKVHLIPMHTLHVGGDDRWIQSDIVNLAENKASVIAHTDHHSARETLELIVSMDLYVSMRYHSLLFATACNVPSAVLDYSRGGKVYSFAEEADFLNSTLDIVAVDADRLWSILQELWRRRTVDADMKSDPLPGFVERSRLVGELIAVHLGQIR